MNQRVLTLAPGGPALGVSLGFEARAVIVDNYTNSYVRLPDVGKDLPPFVQGAAVALPPGIRTARASLVAVTPAVTGPRTPTIAATLTWTDEPLPTDPGHLLQQSQFAVQILIGTVTTPSGAGGEKTSSFTLPAGTVAIGFVVDYTGSNPASVFISGDQTLNTYLDIVAPDFNFGTVWAELISPEMDSSVSCQVVNSGTGSCTVRLVAFLSQAVVQVKAPIGSELAVTMQRSTAAPWQAPNLAAGTGRAGLTAINNATAAQLIAAPGVGKSIYLWELDLTFDAAIVNDFVVDNGAAFNVGLLGPGQFFQLRRSGLQLPANTPLQLYNNSGVNRSFAYATTYQIL